MDDQKIEKEGANMDECCRHGHGPHGGPHGDRHHGKYELPPHIMRELMDMKEKIGKLEGMLEVLMQKL